MSVSSVTNSTAAGGQDVADAVSATAGQMLSEQDFLNLLVTQMTSQDPMNPMTNQDMLSQMVQFGNLQNNTTMQSLLTGMQGSQVFAEASSLIGRQVNLQVDDQTTAQGIVSGVDVSTGVPQIIVGGQNYNLNQVLSVSAAQ
ncbi:MAG TPA: flagellar hook capping FlgD N-terminal domain-containing protein [Verrucomicrobiae bacterium]|nr:flagellar hook capping FlgD N-terminal domain-containing protein [Verrucomicrobiae bacterium]